MDYFKDAFGGFNPQHDKDAALKFCLDALLADHRLDELRRLIVADEEFGGVEGEPGWIIECRENEGDETWPEEARFKAYVDPNSYALAYPEFFSDRKKFFGYVKAIISVYKQRHPEHADKTHEIEKIIETNFEQYE